MSTTALFPMDLDRSALADRAMVAASELPAVRRVELAGASMTGVNFVLAAGVPTSDTGRARLDRALLIVACKDESLLDDAVELL